MEFQKTLLRSAAILGLLGLSSLAATLERAEASSNNHVLQIDNSRSWGSALFIYPPLSNPLDLGERGYEVSFRMRYEGFADNEDRKVTIVNFARYLPLDDHRSNLSIGIEIDGETQRSTPYVKALVRRGSSLENDGVAYLRTKPVDGVPLMQPDEDYLVTVRGKTEGDKAKALVFVNGRLSAAGEKIRTNAEFVSEGLNVITIGEPETALYEYGEGVWLTGEIDEFRAESMQAEDSTSSNREVFLDMEGDFKDRTGSENNGIPQGLVSIASR